MEYRPPPAIVVKPISGGRGDLILKTADLDVDDGDHPQYSLLPVPASKAFKAAGSHVIKFPALEVSQLTRTAADSGRVLVLAFVPGSPGLTGLSDAEVE